MLTFWINLVNKELYKNLELIIVQTTYMYTGLPFGVQKWSSINSNLYKWIDCNLSTYFTIYLIKRKTDQFTVKA